MKLDIKDLLLYAVTDSPVRGGRTLEKSVEEALLGGATFVQLREKNKDYGGFLREAAEIKELCRRYGVPFVVNDNAEIALKSGADGVHVGQRDMSARDARSLIGKDKILGVSAHTVEEAVAAERDGADYLGVGAVFCTGSKADAETIDFSTLEKICKAVKIPVIAIGGINAKNIAQLKGSGVCGVAAISAIFGAEDIRKSTAELKRLATLTVEK